MQHRKHEGASNPSMGKNGGGDEQMANSIKLVETISLQKKMLEDENEDLKSRLSELLNDRTSFFQNNDITGPIA